MKKIILTTLWVVLACALPKIGKAQDTSTIDKLLTYMIAPLNKSQIPTQYLFAAAPLNANNFTNTAMRFDNF